MKIIFKQKDTFMGKKTEIEVLDYEGQLKDLEKALEKFKVVSK